MPYAARVYNQQYAVFCLLGIGTYWLATRLLALTDRAPAEADGRRALGCTPCSGTAFGCNLLGDQRYCHGYRNS